MEYNEIIKFFKTNIWGLIILGAVGSILGGILISLSKRAYNWLATNYKVFRTKRYYNRIIENYSKGYIHGLASQSEIHQSILNTKLIFSMIINSLILIVILIISFGLLSLVPFDIFWIIVLLLGISLVFPILKIRKDIWFLNKMYDGKFDKKKIKKNAEEFLSKDLKKRKAKDFAIKKSKEK
ncbi:hypothetical protein [Tenacibaculum aiptasiae]|uniref:hypothetical protein n=1 Tax=Tenacibaculum aiptasiae TaxID=426481 RepID=UPI002330AF76|nr:hypothetical protein [Tenacibaculum aiptasiae]